MGIGITITIILVILDVFIIVGLFSIKTTNTDSLIRTNNINQKLTNTLVALGNDFTQYQLRTDRYIAKLKKETEAKIKQLERANQKIKENLPNEIRKTIGHIEFAKPLSK